MNTDATALAARLRALGARSADDALGRLANVVLLDPAGVSRFAISELAARAAVSEASVVRLAKALDLSGYRELRVAIAELGTVHDSDVSPSGLADIALNDPGDVVLTKLAAEEINSIKETAALLNVDRLGAVADAIAIARRIDLVGVGASGLVAMDCETKLTRIGLNARAHTDGHQARQAAVLLQPGDVLIGISHSGTTDDVIGTMELAADRGATTVGITAHPTSATARLADYVLLTSASREAGVRPGAISSRTAQMFAIDALFVTVLQRLDSQAQAVLAASFDAVRPLHRGATRRRRAQS